MEILVLGIGDRFNFGGRFEFIPIIGLKVTSVHQFEAGRPPSLSNDRIPVESECSRNDPFIQP